jgi:hypothetical protein
MRKLLISSALILSLAGGATAFAGTTAAATKSAPTAAASKAASCAKQWKAEKTHSQTRKAFMAACEKA